MDQHHYEPGVVPMMMEERGITCDDCGVPLDPTEPAGSPCPKCGCTIHRIHVQASDTLAISEKEKVRVKQKGSGGWTREHIQGAEFFHDAGKWVQKTRTMDKLADHYFEHVVDPETGEVIRHCDEPLSEHCGHGSAKQKQPDETRDVK